MSMNVVTLLYLIASICFIQALKGLSHPATARRGNAFGMTGMAIAAFTTLALIAKLQSEAVAAGGVSGGFGLLIAQGTFWIWQKIGGNWKHVHFHRS